MSQKSVGGNDELGVSVAAHAIDSAGGTSSDGVGVAARVLCGNGDRAIRAADDGTIVIEGVFSTKIDDEASVLRAAHKSDGGANFQAERFVGLGIGKVGGRRGVTAAAAFDPYGARRRRGTACICRGTNAGGIGSRADVTLNFLLRVPASD